ncbi:MAG: sigma-70 family RNA polymerase sigma factor [Maritimibacter sp.]|uniref:RNA polymerase sigma factor n=1 Tax=Maritimibacter sp. TaxID=2003363 RepID=UPI001DB84A75|nr:sigma factor-like helix-turn-helix DNA-binding protein [Maritimibacter sp.]MBL6425915.1 sigma-70 family RNA polymerase sigma factor [Maritimibacter sp.]
MATKHPELARFEAPGDLIAFCHGPGGDPDEKNGVLRALVHHAQCLGDPQRTAASVLTLALWPGLDAIRGRLARYYRGDQDLLAGELVGRLAQGIGSIDLNAVSRIAATLLRNVERDLKRALVRAQGRREDQIDDALPAPDPDTPPLPRDLCNKLRAHIGSDADLVVAVAVFGFSQKEAARALGLSHDAARKRYQRALARLAALIDDGKPSLSQSARPSGFSPTGATIKSRRVHGGGDGA